MVGYLDIIGDDQQAAIILAGQPVMVDRARFGRHIQLLKRSKTFLDALQLGPMAAVRACQNYIDLAVPDEPLLPQASGVELFYATGILIELNDWRAVAHWLDPNLNTEQMGSDAPAPYHYQDRFWATWVHKLASRYGWSRDEIFALWPEEAAYYMQEIQIAEYYEREDDRALSQVSYKYNKATKKSKFVPTPMPSWMINQAPPEPVRTNAAHLPVGVTFAEDQ